MCEVKSIATFALKFYGYIILILASVFPYIQPNWGEGDCPPVPPGSDGLATHGRAVTLHSKSGRKTLVVTLMTIACLRQFSTEKQHIAVRK